MSTAARQLSGIADHVLAHLNLAALKPLHRCRQHVTSGEWVKIAPGAYLDTDIFSGLSQWDCTHAVSIARVVSACLMKERKAFGLSTLSLLGVPLLHIPADVDVLVDSPSGGSGTHFPAVTWQDRLILKAGTLRQHQSSMDPPSFQLTTGNTSRSLERSAHFGASAASCVSASSPASDSLTLTSALLSSSLAYLACSAPAEDAFVALCMGLHAATGRKHIRGTLDRVALDNAQHVVLDVVDQMPKRTRGRRRAALLIQNADGGADSVGEARLQWILKCAGLSGIQTQIPVSGWQETFFIDIGQPECKLAIEFDGISKYGAGSELKHQMSEQTRRQTFIESKGFVMSRVLWDALMQPHKIIKEIEWRLDQVGRTVPHASNRLTRMFGPVVFG